MAYTNQYNYQNPAAPNSSAQNLQFYPSTYGGQVSGHTTPFQASGGVSGGGGGYGSPPGGTSSYGNYASGAPAAFGGGGGGGGAGVSGRMGEQMGLRTGWLAAFGTEGYENEPGLMQELGVNFGHIKTKTFAVLNPLSTPSPHIMDDSDLYGGLLFLILYGTFLALSGKFFYGYIYGIALFGSIALHWIFALMTPPLDPNDAPMQQQNSSHDHRSLNQGGHFSSTLTYSRSASVLGYSFLPLVLTSLLGIALPMDSLLGYVVTSTAVGWCTYSSSGMFVSVGRMRGMRGLVAYPLGLFYVGFGIMGIFSSRGSGMLEGKVM